ncbi:ABC transporter ATP-binding protein [Halosolutus gelatinilyticus]|uniref:ABC transporter ATP-binding protein n=1 Tax=Halosolutus gelatinilyticus TaxID=2931975 RepID=UPI001FF4056C|nr:ABC transporter ATP-binding protein [Halosolutus gelatinilyticus]
MSDLLTVRDLSAYYGESQVLFDVDIDVEKNGVIGIFGRNGMGKTTLLDSIVNRIDRKAGTIRFRGTDITDWPTHDIIRQDIAYVPEDREIYPALSVRENLEVATPKGLSDEVKAERIRTVYDRFERLEERAGQRGGTLSGGEQQMLAIGRALVTEPDLLLLDEPTEGLAPIIVDDVVSALEELAARDQAVLLVEQNITKTLPLIERGYIIEGGEIVVEGTADRLSDETLHEEYLTI